MNNFLRGVAQAAAETFEMRGPVLEVGSYQVAGQESIADLRGLFPGKAFIGTDMRPGDGVDRIENVESLSFADDCMGTVIAMNVFEHVEKFWLGFDEIQRVLRPDGVALISCPFYFHIHDYPSDYWRFTPEALDSLFHTADAKILGWHGAKARPANVWMVAFGKQYGSIDESDRQRFHDRIKRYAHEPIRWSKTIRYNLCRIFVGRGNFAPYLDLERFDTKLSLAATADTKVKAA